MKNYLFFYTNIGFEGSIPLENKGKWSFHMVFIVPTETSFLFPSRYKHLSHEVKDPNGDEHLNNLGCQIRPCGYWGNIRYDINNRECER